jgi:hypothetical protein
VRPPPATARYAAAVVLVLGVASARVIVESRAALKEGRSQLQGGAVEPGVRALRRAAHLYLPGNPANADAYETLERFAREQESVGHQDHALLAWRAVRSSALATRWIIVPHRERLDRANRRIARLMALLPPPLEERDTPVGRREEMHYALLQEDRAPEPAWVLVLGVGLALWLGGAFHAARHGWDDDDRPRGSTLAATGAAVTVGLILCGLALLRA